MAYYGGTVTVGGRNMLAGLLRGGTITLTRVVVGKGHLAEGEFPLDRTELVDYVAEGSSTPPIVKDGAVSLTVEYRNDMNGGLKEGFWLSEFGIYAQTEADGEVLFYYATLGDSPQPVSRYAKDRIDIRRYPITIALEVDAEVRVLYDMTAFVTSQNVLELVQTQVEYVLSSGAILPVNVNITIPHEGWNDPEPGMPQDLKYHDISCVGMHADTVPIVTLLHNSLKEASVCGISNTCEALEDYLRVYTMNPPAQDLYATVTMYLSGIHLRGDWSQVDPETMVDWSRMPPATADRLGGVKIGENVTVEDDGKISVLGPDVVDDVLATEEHIEGMLDDVFGDTNGDG